MAYRTLSEFVRTLEKKGELVRVSTFVDPVFEIAEIADRMAKSRGGGKALLFENTGTAFPLLINAFGSERRMTLALGTDSLDDIAERINSLFKEMLSPREGILNKLRLLPTLAEMGRWMPGVKNGKGECQEIRMDKPDLSKLPVLKCWPADGGRFITLPMVITKDPLTGVRNMGMYRMQIFENDVTGMHWHKHKVGARHFQEYKKLGKKMPVAVALGGDPAHIYAATAPLPDNIDEFMLSGFLRNKKVELVKALTQDIEVPADADFIIEGYVDPEEDFFYEGPFGDHTGFYSLEDYFPGFHVTCITHRREAIYPATIVGIPPQEDAWLAKATERIFLNPIRFAIAPEILDMHMPDEGVAHNLTLVQIEKSYPGQAQKVAHALWGAGQMMFNKVMLIADKESSLHDIKSLVRRVLTNFRPLQDLFFNTGPLDILDHSSQTPAFGSKMGIDATSREKDTESMEYPWKTISLDESGNQPFSPEGLIKLVHDKLMKEDIPVRWLGIKKNNGKGIMDQFLDHSRNKDIFSAKINVLIDPEIITDNVSLLVWITLANIDPLRDSYILTCNNKQSLIIDATRKTMATDKFTRRWPNYVASDPALIKRIDAKWESLNLGDFIPSPSVEILSWGLGTTSSLSN